VKNPDQNRSDDLMFRIALSLRLCMSASPGTSIDAIRRLHDANGIASATFDKAVELVSVVPAKINR
jgi:hypothetical protein